MDDAEQQEKECNSKLADFKKQKQAKTIGDVCLGILGFGLMLTALLGFVLSLRALTVFSLVGFGLWVVGFNMFNGLYEYHLEQITKEENELNEKLSRIHLSKIELPVEIPLFTLGKDNVVTEGEKARSLIEKLKEQTKEQTPIPIAFKPKPLKTKVKNRVVKVKRKKRGRK